MALIAPGVSQDLQDLLDSPPAQDLVDATSDIVCWVNDLFSLEKELACGEVINLVLVMEYHQDLTRQQAVTAVQHRIFERAHDFIRAERHIADTAHPVHTRDIVQRAVASMRGWIGGCLRWHRESARFTDHDPTTATRVDLLTLNAAATPIER